MHTQLETMMLKPRIADEFDVQVKREWLLTNGRGGYASGTAVGVPTRRYHGLLIAAARPPLERWLLLASVLERVVVNGQEHELASFEFEHAFHPRGFEWQTDFETSNNPREPWAHFVFEAEGMRLSKSIIVPRGSDEVWLHYRLSGPKKAALSLDLLPFVAMRDFHGLTHAFDGGFPVGESEGAITIDAYTGGPRLWLKAERIDSDAPVGFDRKPDWWYGFNYREEANRGQDHREDLFTPGWLRTSGSGSVEVLVRAAADFSEGAGGSPFADTKSGSIVSKLADQVKQLSANAVEALPVRAKETVEQRLRDAADTFIVKRSQADGRESITILAGYHWFGDWGRDAFIALPGLLLETGRFAEAREVLETFASAQSDGLIPNRFSDYGDGCDYNSVDASLWFIHAATLYVQKSGDQKAWRDTLGPTCDRIIQAYMRGTRFNIHMDADSLISCGDPTTQLTWMDAKFGDIVFTPRHGKPVEINALWYHALLAVADQIQNDDAPRANALRDRAERVAVSFASAFWNESSRCLYDVVRDRWKDRSIRPNQILAVSLPHSPLDEVKQRAVLSCVECDLLTPYGLRSLSWRDSAYRRRYEGNMFQRDSAYHQGTVWGWLIGPYVEAYLRVNEYSAMAKTKMRTRLASLIAHLDSACIDSVSEIFDGDPPHTPRGAIAQAWSLAELLRAWRMTEFSD